MRSLVVIQRDWDLVQNAPEDEPETDEEVRAQERLYDDIPHLLQIVRRLDEMIAAVLEDFNET